MNKKAFITLFVALFAAELGMGIISPLMPLYAESIGASGLWLGIMYSGFALSRAIFMPILGKLSDRRGRKIFIAIGLLAYTVTSLAYVLAYNVYALTSVRLLHGLASAMVIPIAQAYIGDLTPKGREGTYMNLFTMSMFLGMGSGPFLGGFLADTFYMNAGFYAMAGLTALALILLLLLVPTVESLSERSKRKPSAPLRTIIRDNEVKAISLSLASRAFYRQGITAFLPILAVSTMGMSIASIGSVLSIFILTGGVAQGLFGPLADRFNKKRLIVIGSITAPIFIFFIPHIPAGAMLLTMLIPTALLSAVARAAIMALNVELGVKHSGMGSVMGVSRSVMSLGMVIGPLVFGYTMDHFGIGSVFQVGATVGILVNIPAIYFLYKK
ncbi:MFS transporter [Chloroflexota bacterium]